MVSVSTMKRAANSIDRLRRLIYDVSCRLQLSSDGTSCRLLLGGGVHYLDTWSIGLTSHAVEYKKNMAEDDPRALFQEQIPMSFLELQKAIKKEVASRSVTGNPPVMVEEEFKYECWLC